MLALLGRAFNPVYDGFEGGGGGGGRWGGVGLQATRDGNEGVDHFVAQFECKCSVMILVYIQRQFTGRFENTIDDPE
jgi:hypothetical protein